MRTLIILISCLLSSAGNDSLLVRSIADNVLESYRIEYVDRATKEVYTSLESIKEGAEVRIGCKFMDWHYSTGILNSAMMHLSEFTADDRYAEYARNQVDYCLESYPFFTQGPAEDHRPFHFLRKFRELDHVGTECAALIRLVEKYPHLKKSYLPYIEKAAGHIRNGQARLEDGTLVRTRPVEHTLWADDLYMGLSFMAKYGAWKKDRKMLEDAVSQVESFNNYLLNSGNGLYWHGYDQQKGTVVGAHWGRCNGWMMFAMTTLMDYIKDDKVLMDRVLPIFRNHVKNICRYQDSDGMWHQLLDDPQSYKESSCTVIFICCMARAIVNGWLDSSYASAVLKGWDAICTGQISGKYELKNVCVGTGIGGDRDFYRNRRKVDGEIHGTGLLIEAGMAVVRLGKFLNT
jgi:rhamnogalacturonyl hydrolase YesR